MFYLKLILLTVAVANNIATITSENSTLLSTTTTLLDSEPATYPFKGPRHDDFDWNLTKAILFDNDKNVIISPFSIKLLLSLLAEAAGADTSTHRELSSVLPSINSANHARELYGKIFGSLLETSADYDLDLGTKIYVDKFVQPRQRYAAIIESYYYTSIENVDFSHSDAVADMINRWCRNITKDNIKQLVTKDDIDGSVMLMLNAIYFNGYWSRPFPTNGTVQMPFFKTPTTPIKTDFMSQTGNFYYLQSTQLNAQILRIPYKGQKFAMNIILPNEKKTMREVLQKMDLNILHHEQFEMDELEVHVVLPKFKFDTTSVLNKVLQSLGIQQIFTSEASLPALARGTAVKDRLQVSKVLQKAGIFVNERGSTVYAATDVMLTNKFGGDMTREFVANRPFLFFIEDETTGTLLFSGQVTSPNEFISLNG